MNPRNGFLRSAFAMLIVAPALHSFNGKQKGPIESTFLFASSLVGMIGIGWLEIWAYIRDKKQPPANRTQADITHPAPNETAIDPDWMGTREGRKRRLTMTAFLMIALVGTAIVILNVLR